jgi:signal peptidase I
MLRIIGWSLKWIIISILVVFVGMMACVYFLDDYSAYIVKSNSMQPTIKSGDMVFTGRPGRPLVGDIVPGGIITFQRHDETVTHRVEAIEGDIIYTRGDALEETDPWTVSRFFDVKGCYLFHIPYVGLISSYLKTRTGWFLCVILPAMCLLGLIVREIIREARRSFPYLPVKQKPYPELGKDVNYLKYR